MQSRFCILKNLYCALRESRDHGLSKETFRQLLLETLVMDEDPLSREHLRDLALCDLQEPYQPKTDITPCQGGGNVAMMKHFSSDKCSDNYQITCVTERLTGSSYSVGATEAGACLKDGTGGDCIPTNTPGAPPHACILTNRCKTTDSSPYSSVHPKPAVHLSNQVVTGGREVRTDHTGHTCREETLLMLSCVTLVVGAGQCTGHPGVGMCTEHEAGCLDVGQSSEGVHSVPKRRHVHLNGTDDSLIEDLKEMNILTVLLKLSHGEDMFIKYTASKAILAVVKCPSFNSTRECFLEEVMFGVTNSRQASVRTSNMELLKHFMSNRHGLDLNTWCHQHLTSSKILKAEYVETILRCREPQCIDELNMFLTLLQKIVKFVHKFEKELKESYLGSLLGSNQEHLLQFLVRSLQCVNKPEGRILCKKTLDIFNTFLPYGSHLAERKDIASVYSLMCEKLLSELCPSALTSAPFVCHFVCFGGCHVEGTQARSQNGDLALLRKLTLALLKACAMIVRLTTEVHSRQHLLSTCLNCISQLMHKTFDARDLQWLPLVFGDQDDAWLEVLLCLLDIYLNTLRLSPDSSLLHQVNPHPIFLEFMESNDHMVLVDLLTSPETCFLLYFLRYLKCLVCEWDKFVTACHLRFCVSQEELMNKYLQNSVKIGQPSGRDGEYGSSESSQTLTVCSGAITSSPSQPTTAGPSPTHPSLAQQTPAQPSPSQQPSPQPRVHCSGLSYLTTYSDSDDDGDGDICSATTLTQAVMLTPGTVPPVVKPKQTTSLSVSGDALHENRCGRPLSESPCLNNPCCEATSDSVHHPSLNTLALLPGGSVMSCDYQCVESVMSELIRVGLRIERLSSQQLFPYNAGPLLSLLEQCELLYEGMEAHGHGQ
ncbi:uncharacterized protein [Haliotis cracherodii]|uniref:uncharacterized protein n=1 Tax=Haliotis cracherodii TaxID=6455 RepID=UPI0039E73374